MTRKHYVVMAEILKFHMDEMPAHTHIKLVDDFVNMLKIDNPNFDEQRFRTACGQ